MQFMDREPIYHDHIPPPSSGHGFYKPKEMMTLRWNSRLGTVYQDGAHMAGPNVAASLTPPRHHSVSLNPPRTTSRRLPHDATHSPTPPRLAEPPRHYISLWLPRASLLLTPPGQHVSRWVPHASVSCFTSRDTTRRDRLNTEFAASLHTR